MGNADGSHRLPQRAFRGSHCLGATAADGLIQEVSCHIERLPVKYTRGRCLPSMLLGLFAQLRRRFFRIQALRGVRLVKLVLEVCYFGLFCCQGHLQTTPLVHCLQRTDQQRRTKEREGSNELDGERIDPASD